MDNALRSFWAKYFKFNWKFGLWLIVIVCVPRFFFVLNANQTGNYGPIGAIMMASAIVPLIFLDRQGMKQIGLVKSKNWSVLIISLFVGIAFSLALYWVGTAMYDHSIQNWYVYIGLSYNIPETIAPQDKHVMFGIMAITGMIFSPIGEELFFRGIVHGSFESSIGGQRASLVDSMAFALTHVAHFGLVYVSGNWEFYLIPTLIWVTGMFVLSIIFFQLKRLSGSLLGAILCHSGFNLGMIYTIFYWF